MKTISQRSYNETMVTYLRAMIENIESGNADVIGSDSSENSGPYDPRLIALGEYRDDKTYMGEHRVSITLRYPGQG